MTDVSATVKRVESFRIGGGGAKDWVWIRLESSDGVVGWGECYTVAGREAAVRAIADELGTRLVRSPVEGIVPFTAAAYRDFATKRWSMEVACAVSGIEQAMWDVVGKSVGRPVHALLGGACRSEVRVYANGWSYGEHGGCDDVEAACVCARELVAAGWDALKLDPFRGLWNAYVGRREVEDAVACIEAVRGAVGPHVDILVEAHRRLSPAAARSFARALEPLEPYWLEEPVDCRNLEGLAAVAEATTIPVVAGETLYSRPEFARVLAARAASILNPDVCSCGGILELTHVAASADAELVAVAPHNYNSTALGLAATLQASAVMPNFLLTEYFVNAAPRSRELVRSGLEPVGGRVAVPSGPGLGIDVDEEAVRHAGM